MALVETCLASNEGCVQSTKVAREVPGLCMKAQGCTRSARGVREGMERMSIVTRDKGNVEGRLYYTVVMYYIQLTC